MQNAVTCDDDHTYSYPDLRLYESPGDITLGGLHQCTAYESLKSDSHPGEEPVSPPLPPMRPSVPLGVPIQEVSLGKLTDTGSAESSNM